MLVTCPDPACEAPAEILDRLTVGSTDGRIDHAKTYCVRHHIFVLPIDRVPGAVGPAVPPWFGSDLDPIQTGRRRISPNIT
jgi:hypothetical protein